MALTCRDIIPIAWFSPVKSSEKQIVYPGLLWSRFEGVHVMSTKSHATMKCKVYNMQCFV